MSKAKKSSSQPGGMKTGLLIGGILFVIVLAMGVVGLNLLGYVGNRQAAVIAPPLTGKVSSEDIAVRREQEQARLNTYGWADKNAGVVRIPIAQAMALIAANGLPVGEPTATPLPTTAPTPTGPSETSEPVATSAPTGPGKTPEPVATPAPTVDLAHVSFTQNVLPLFEQHCTECHGGKRPEQGLSLESYDGVMKGSDNGSVIEPGNVADSYLIEMITSGKMPKKGPHLTPTEIQIISVWVEQGASNN